MGRSRWASADSRCGETAEDGVPARYAEGWESAPDLAASLGPPEPAIHAPERDHRRDGGQRTGRRRRAPVGFIEEDGKLVVVAEDGTATSWVRNALDRDGQLRIFLRGSWREARLRPRSGDPEDYLRLMGRTHAALVRMESSNPGLIEITPEKSMGPSPST